MSITIPDPIATAQAEAARIKANPELCLEWGINRVLTDAPFIERESLLAGLEAFHVERMEKIPSHTTYPEAQPWVDYVMAVDKELQALTGMTTRQLAMYRSLNHYLTFRGYSNAKPAMVEKCRIIYLPETDQGAFHIPRVSPNIRW